MFTNTTIGVGFGTAGLGSSAYDVVLMALENGFTKFDTAEEKDYWYDSAAVGRALSDYFLVPDDECVIDANDEVCGRTCESAGLQISTKIPPWSLTSEEDIRQNAATSRQQLLDFCEDFMLEDGSMTPFPLDVYYIHAPRCWQGWHTRCDNPPPLLLDLHSAWRAMEAVVGVDHSARRIGLSNVHPDELLDIIHFVQERQHNRHQYPPPRMPDVLQAYADPIEPAEELRRICQEHNIEFVSYSTLGTQHTMRRGKNPVLDSPVIKSIAEQHGRSAAEVVLSWAIQKGMSVIPRSSKRMHIEELARLLNTKDASFLSETDLERIDSMKHSI
jgi:diketogulonate reductase-like aldo/keto reductase